MILLNKSKKIIYFLNYLYSAIYYFLNSFLSSFYKKSIKFTHNNFSIENEIICIVYIMRGTSLKELKSSIKFIRSFKKFKPGISNILYIACKGFKDNAYIEKFKKKFDSNYKYLNLEDNSFDLGAYLQTVKLTYFKNYFFLNTHSEIRADNWLRKIYFPMSFIGKNIGMVGTSCSIETLKILDPNFPDFPNPHIRTNGFLIPRDLFLEYSDRKSFSSKKDCWFFESGLNSLTNFIKEKKYNYVVVDRKGNVYQEEEFIKSGLFRSSIFKKSIISDNQIRDFEELSLNKKIKSFANTWLNVNL